MKLCVQLRSSVFAYIYEYSPLFANNNRGVYRLNSLYICKYTRMRFINRIFTNYENVIPILYYYILYPILYKVGYILYIYKFAIPHGYTYYKQ